MIIRATFKRTFCLSKVGNNRPLVPNSLPLFLKISYHPHYISFISERPSIQKPKLLIIRPTFKHTFFAFPRSQAIVRLTGLPLYCYLRTFFLSYLGGTRYRSNRYHPAVNCCVLNPHLQPVPGSTLQSTALTWLFYSLSLANVKQLTNESH